MYLGSIQKAENIDSIGCFQENRGKFEFVALVAAAGDPIVRLVNLDITLQYNKHTLISSSKRETVSLLKCFTQLHNAFRVLLSLSSV